MVKYKFTNRLYVKVAGLKAKKGFKNKTKQVLDKSLIYPKITIGVEVVNNYIRSKKVPFLTMDEEVMRWADHKNHS